MVDGELTAYLGRGIEHLLKDAWKAAAHHPREAMFLLRYTLVAKQAQRKRRRLEQKGMHIPPFLIASITSSCNLRCAGCYARANHICCDHSAKPLLTVQRWGELFHEAHDIGVSFILLAGGEPLLRHEVIREAAKHKNILFPVFTNGTLVDDGLLALLDHNRNLVPILSVEGDEAATDARRGDGVHDTVMYTMRRLSEKGILFGASVTVTTENIDEVTNTAFIEGLRDNGCRILFYVEYVPADRQSEHLAPTDAQRERLDSRLCELRADRNMLFLSFPGDEKRTGGCLAAGRGFFHINPYGAAEPCPFSPYSDSSVTTSSLLEALRSPLFTDLKEKGLVGGEHIGGCALFLREREVRELCGQQTQMICNDKQYE